MNFRRSDLMALCGLMLSVIAVLLSLRPAGPAWAGPPHAPAAPDAIASTLNYQGILRDETGALVTGTRTMTFKIYDAAVNGNVLHSETINNVAVRDGLFTVVLGDATPIGANVFADAPRFIGLTVGSDPEMAPRQRLHPVPWAQQATTAVNATTAATTNSLAPGATASELVGTGTAPNRSLTLSDRVSVTGDLTVKARRDVGSTTTPVQITTSTYDVSIRRYVVEAPDGGATPNSVPVDDAMLNQLCADEDGCTITLGMRDWNTPADRPGLLATVGPWRFSITAATNGKRNWDLRYADGAGAVHGEDGNGTTEPIANALNGCIFTDGKWQTGVDLGDQELGLSLLNWHGIWDSPNMVCVLIIED